MGIEAMDFLNELGIDKIGFEEDNKYIVELEDSNNYQELFELLDTNDLVKLVEDSVEFEEDYNKVTFVGGKYRLDLIADFKNEKYRLEVFEEE